MPMPTTFTFEITNEGCPYFYNEGYYCSHVSVRAMCEKRICPMISAYETKPKPKIIKDMDSPGLY